MRSNNPEDLPLLDDEQIEMLTSTEDLDSADLLIELLELFEGEAVEKMEELRNELPAGNAKIVSAAAHSIAGSSANIGCKRLWAVAKNIEALANDGDLVEVGATLGQLETIYSESMIGLRDVIQRFND
jgi:HPt (histidine-containing phosphotransfer) domain-containing protein